MLTRAADSAPAAQPSPRYLDTQAPIDERVADLIGRLMAIQTWYSNRMKLTFMMGQASGATPP